MCDNSRLKEIRNIRLSQNTVPNYIELDLVKSLFRHSFSFKQKQIFTPKFIQAKCIHGTRNMQYNVSDIIISVIALHFNIIFNDEECVENYLKTFRRLHGLMATKLLVNYQFMENIINPCCGNGFNALMTACLWTNNINMVNVLYNYGADLSSINSSGLYCEELHSNIPYYNPFSNYLKYHYSCQYNNNHVWGYRIGNNFLDIIHHVRLICGETVQPGFKFPTRITISDIFQPDNVPPNQPPHDQGRVRERDNETVVDNDQGVETQSNNPTFDVYYNYELIMNSGDEQHEEEDDNEEDDNNDNVRDVDDVHLDNIPIDDNSFHSPEPFNIEEEDDEEDDEDNIYNV